MRTQIAGLAFFAVWVSVTTSACRHDAAEKNAWIRGDSHERWTMDARHLRGLDVAMVEIGYRYQELYWAGVDANWQYADYQLKKIDLTLENALERRPERRASAETLFAPALGEVQQAIVLRDRGGSTRRSRG